MQNFFGKLPCLRNTVSVLKAFHVAYLMLGEILIPDVSHASLFVLVHVLASAFLIVVRSKQLGRL